MPNVDLEALKRSLSAIPPSAALRLRNSAVRHSQTKVAAIAAQEKREAIKILKDTAEQAGFDDQKLKLALARNRKQTTDAIAALRPSLDARPVKSVGDRISSRFRRLRPLAGLTVPLAPPSLTFLNAPEYFTADETGSYLQQSSREPDNTFFQALFSADEPGKYGTYTFTYVWSNETDTAMLTSV
jgi:hypothetical protein